MRHIFKMTLLSDVILHAKSATEGNQETLDFIPGSNFLGIVAKDYDKFDNAYDIFHSGKVKFGDAHIAKDGEKSFKAPLSWFYKKGDSIQDKLWIHHALTKEKREELIKNGIQIKQARSGWILKEGKELKIRSNYSLKSAYDREKRRSKDGAMFGFKAFESGSEWIFYIDIDDDIDVKSILDKLEGKHHIGKSRSAQYGSVKIEKIKHNFVSQSTDKLFEDKSLVIYAESRLAFFDECGSPTLQPTAKDFGLTEEWTLDWSKSQTRSQVYAPYNFTNRSFHADRVCFTKGSAFVFEANSPTPSLPQQSVVGEYQNEGFGQLIFNPRFLKANSSAEAEFKVLENEKKSKEDKKIVKIEDPKGVIEKWLNSQIDIHNNEKKLYQAVADFVKEKQGDFDKITRSQWGQIRAIATQYNTVTEVIERLFAAETGYLMHGVSEKDWKPVRDKLRDELEKEKNQSFGTEYCVRLATQMQKEAKK